MKQSTATINAIMSVLKGKGIDYELGGETPVSQYQDMFKAEVKSILCEGFKSGEIDLSATSKVDKNDETSLGSYVNGLISNWVRKHPDFNAGGKYEPKNPGSRTGSQDEQVKAMRGLLAQTTDESDKETIQEAIDARLAEIKPESKVEINVEALPESLRHLVK